MNTSTSNDLLEILEDFDKYRQVNGTRFEGELTKPYVSDLLGWLRQRRFYE